VSLLAPVLDEHEPEVLGCDRCDKDLFIGPQVDDADLCHECRTAATRDDTHIPQLEFPPPPCPVCGKDLDCVDGWECAGCSLYWDSTGNYGAHANTDLLACGDTRDVQLYPPVSRMAPDKLAEMRERRVCKLDQGHEGAHAGYDPTTVTRYCPPSSWDRWNDKGERAW
jgi:hypothetical protein